MKDKRKAIFLSALVLPGLGQLALKRYKSGAVILVSVVYTMSQYMNLAMQQANQVVSRMMQQGGALDMQSLSNAASQSAGANASDVFFWLIVICWLVSVLDIMFVKHRADKQR